MVRMVEVGGKRDVCRRARAAGKIRLRPETVRLVREGRVEKGDVESVASVAAIMAVKNTPNILPLCHPIPITGVNVSFDYGEDNISVVVEVSTTYKTGVEMDALTGVMAALLTIWDMVKKYEKDQSGQYPHTRIEDVRVVEKVKEEC